MPDDKALQQTLVDIGCWEWHLIPPFKVRSAIVFMQYGECKKCPLKNDCWGLQWQELTRHTLTLKRLSIARMAANWSEHIIHNIDAKKIGL